MENFPVDRTIRVSNERYTLEHLLSLQRCAFTRKILVEFPSEFSVLAETEFASFVCGAGCLHLEKLLHTLADAKLFPRQALFPLDPVFHTSESLFGVVVGRLPVHHMRGRA